MASVVGLYYLTGYMLNYHLTKFIVAKDQELHDYSIALCQNSGLAPFSFIMRINHEIDA